MSTEPTLDPYADPPLSLLEELRAVPLLTRTVPAIVRDVCGQAADRLEQVEAERDVLLSIVQDLAARHPGFDTHTSCLFCADAVEDHTDPDCLWVRARAFLASRETPEGEPK